MSAEKKQEQKKKEEEIDPSREPELQPANSRAGVIVALAFLVPVAALLVWGLLTR